MQMKVSQVSAAAKIRPCGRGLTSPVLPTDVGAVVPAGKRYRSGWVRLSLNAIEQPLALLSLKIMLQVRLTRFPGWLHSLTLGIVDHSVK